MHVQFDREKFNDLVHLVCSKCDETRLGAVKLHKVLYYVDMIRYAAEGRPVSGATYRKRPFGPTADYLLTALDELQNLKKLHVYEQDYFGYNKKCFKSLEEPNTARFDATELALVEETVDFVCNNNTARSISEFSHNLAWERTDAGEEIPYYTAIELFPEEISEDTLDWAKGVGGDIEEIHSRKGWMDFEEFRHFRDRILETHQNLS